MQREMIELRAALAEESNLREVYARAVAAHSLRKQDATQKRLHELETLIKNLIVQILRSGVTAEAMRERLYGR